MTRNLFRILLIVSFISIFQSVWAEEDLTWELDSRPWKEGFHKEGTDKSVISEYVLPPETVHNWKELVTVQQFYGLQERVSLMAYLISLEKQLKKACPNIQWKTFEYSGSIMYEFLVKGCPGQDDQQELARIIRGKEGIWVLHYATKRNIPLSDEQRKKWLNILKSARLSESH